MAAAKARRKEPDHNILTIGDYEYKHGLSINEEMRDKIKLINARNQSSDLRRHRWPMFDILSMNMDKKRKDSAATVPRRKTCLSFCLKNLVEPDIVFAQEVFSPTKRNFSLDMDEFHSKGTKETGLMWRDSRCTPVSHLKLDAKYKEEVRVRTKTVLKSKGIAGDCSYFPGKTTAAVLECTDPPNHGGVYILAIAWHGQNNFIPATKKKKKKKIFAKKKEEDFFAFQYFALELRRSLPPQYKEIGIVIGGDFNLDLLKKNSRMHPDFAMQRYEMTKRRRDSNKRLIDAFLFTYAQLTIRSTKPLDLDMTSNKVLLKCGLSQEVLHSVDHDPVKATLIVRPLLYGPPPRQRSN